MGLQVSNRNGITDLVPFGMPSLTLTYRDYNFSFRYAALDFVHPELTTYTYRLDDFDQDWVEAGERRFVMYTNVPPGIYTFRVKATTYNNIEAQPLAFSLTITPPFWQTWWFRLLGMAALAGLLVTTHRLRVARLLALERMRLRIAGDLHDDLSSDLSGIALATDVIRQRPYLDDADRHQVENVRNTALHMLDALRDIVWYINPEHDTMEGLVSRMRHTADSLLHGIDYEIVVESSVPSGSLKMALRRHLFLVYKEALNNIARHARAKHVRVGLFPDHGRLLLEVIDDGIGFEPQKEYTGHGLKSMWSRAKQMNADLIITSRPGEGTTVRISVKMESFRDGLR